jgi:heme A synthase
MDDKREPVGVVDRLNYYLIRMWAWRQTMPEWVRLFTSLLFVPAFFLLIIIVGITVILLHDIVPIGFFGRFFIAAVIWAVTAYWVGTTIQSRYGNKHTQKNRK